MVSPLRNHRQKPQTVSQRLLNAISTELTSEKLEADLTSQPCFICKKHEGERTLSFLQSNDEEARLLEQAIELRRYGRRLGRLIITHKLCPDCGGLIDLLKRLTSAC